MSEGTVYLQVSRYAPQKLIQGLTAVGWEEDDPNRCRSVPVPPDYLDTLNTAHSIRKVQQYRKRMDEPIWPLTRARVWQIVKAVMIEAGIADAPHRSPKGLRHGFGINATTNGVQLHMLQKWMGHA